MGYYGTSLDRDIREGLEDGSLRHWDIGEYVVVHALNDLVGPSDHSMEMVCMITWSTMKETDPVSGVKLLI